jgi:hypothetical protein
VVTAPTGFEVSKDNSSFSSSVSFTPSGGTVSSQTVYARLTSSSTGTPSGNIACTSTGATTQNISASGTVNPLPTITLGSVSSVNTSATIFSLPYSDKSSQGWSIIPALAMGAYNQGTHELFLRMEFGNDHIIKSTRYF